MIVTPVCFLIHLYRPQALNSLDVEMVERILQLLDSLSSAAATASCIVIKGAGDKVRSVKSTPYESQNSSHPD